MNPDVVAFLLGYREGREGMAPTASDAMTEQELAALESTNPPLSTNAWMWHLVGWTVGQAVALHELGKG
jgi:hypothetical protein